LNFQFVVNPEVDTKECIQLPTELVILHGGHNAKQFGFFKKTIQHVLRVQYQFHKSDIGFLEKY
jgi:hypothetical protein